MLRIKEARVLPGMRLDVDEVQTEGLPCETGSTCARSILFGSVSPGQDFSVVLHLTLNYTRRQSGQSILHPMQFCFRKNEAKNVTLCFEEAGETLSLVISEYDFENHGAFICNRKNDS